MIDQDSAQRDKRRRRRGRWIMAERVAYLALLALILLAVVDERGARQTADQASLADRLELQQRAVRAERRADTIECTVRGVLEVSRDRAASQGQLAAADVALYVRVLAPLRDDCPSLIVPPKEPAP